MANFALITFQAAATAVYDGMASLFNEAMGQPHMAAFMEPVSKQEYPSYHLVSPISLRSINVVSLLTSFYFLIMIR
jgi:hypothetical protein